MHQKLRLKLNIGSKLSEQRDRGLYLSDGEIFESLFEGQKSSALSLANSNSKGSSPTKLPTIHSDTRLKISPKKLSLNLSPKNLQDPPEDLQLKSNNKVETYSFLKWLIQIKKKHVNKALENPTSHSSEKVSSILNKSLQKFSRLLSSDNLEKAKAFSEILDLQHTSFELNKQLEITILQEKLDSLYSQLETISKIHIDAEVKLNQKLKQALNSAASYEQANQSYREELTALKYNNEQLEKDRDLHAKTSFYYQSKYEKAKKHKIQPFKKSDHREYVYDNFFRSRKIQVTPASASKKINVCVNVIDAEIQTEGTEFVEKSSEFVQDDVPNVIVVTTENNESLLEYAYIPSQVVVENNLLKRGNTLGPDSYQAFSQDEPLSPIISRKESDASPMIYRRDSDLSIINEHTFSVMSDTDEQDTSKLLLPDSSHQISETLGVHSLNPDPFTSSSPDVSSSSIGKRPKFTRTEEKDTQTERDLLLESEETEILQEMIEYKTDLLKQVDRQLYIAKSKLLSANSQQKQIEEEKTTPDIEQLFAILQKDGKIPPELDIDSWKLGFTCAVEQKPVKKQDKVHLAVKIAHKYLTSDKTTHLTSKLTVKKVKAILEGVRHKKDRKPLIEYAYEYVKNIYHDKGSLQKKFGSLLIACLKYTEHLAVKVFVKLLGIGKYGDISDYARPVHSFVFYSEFMTTVGNSKSGIMVPLYNSGDTHYIPVVRAMDALKVSLGGMLSSEKIDSMIKVLESSCKADPQRLNPGGVVNLDFVIDLALKEFDTHSQEAISAVDLLSQGFDLEKTGSLHVLDIVMIVRHLVPHKIDLLVHRKEYTPLFNLIRFGKDKNFVKTPDLIELCIKKGLVSIADVQTYLGGDIEYEVQAFDFIKSELMRNLDILNEIEKSREQVGITEEVETIWRSKIRFLDSSLDVNPKAIYLAFRIFMDEVKRLQGLIFYLDI